MPQDRRKFILQSAQLLSGAAFTLSPLACGPAPIEEPLSADGTYENPFTRADPGEWKEKIEIHQPVLYGSLAENGSRLWVEVIDVTTGVTHPMVADHFIERILIQDNYDNIIADVVFPYNAQARIVTTVQIPIGVESIKVYEKCNLHGWWLAEYGVSLAFLPPESDFRRPYDVENPGQYVDKVESHLPYLGEAPNGDLIVEIGNRTLGKLHPMDADHYISDVILLDHYGQIRGIRELSSPDNAEPVVNFGQQRPSPTWRLLAKCNLHGWWEALYFAVDAESFDNPASGS